MNTFHLKTAFAPAQHDVHVRDVTVGNLIHEIESRRAPAKAFVEVKNKGVTNLRWTSDWRHNATIDD